jgi:hypothetical protein
MKSSIRRDVCPPKTDGDGESVTRPAFARQ